MYVSSVSAAGPTTRGRAVTEIAPPRPVSDYGASKLAGEEVARAAPIPWTIVRPPTIYGPRDMELLRVFRLARWRVAPVFGTGTQELSVIHVRDLVRALLCATDPSTERRTYFASHPQIVTSKTLVKAIHVAVQRTLGHDPEGGPLIVPLPAWFTRAALAAIGGVAGLAGKATVLSPNKGDEFLAEAWTCLPTALERDTGWRADIPLADGLDETARWYRQHGWL